MKIFREYILQWKSFNRNIRAFLIFDLCNHLSIAVYVLYFPRYLIELGHNEDFYGSLMGTATLMTAVFAILAGIISDRIGRRNSLMIGIGISKITYITRAFIVLIPVLFGSHIIHGIFIALYNSTAMPFIFENATAENRIHAYSVRGIFMRLSNIIGNLIGGLLPLFILSILPDMSTIAVYRIIFTLSLIIAAIGFLQLLYIKPSADERFIARQEKKRLIEQIKDLPQEDFRFILKFVIVRGSIMFGAGMFLPFMNTYFLRRFEASHETTGLIFSLVNFAVILGIALAPGICEKLGMERAIVITRVMSFPMFVIMAFGPKLWIVAAAYMARNTFQQMSGPLQNTFIMRGLDRKTRATANGILSAAGNGARSIAMFVAGYVIVNLGYSYLFIVALGFYIISTVFFYKFFVYDQNKTIRARGV